MNEQACENGIDAIKAADYSAAVRDFEECHNSIDEHHEKYNKIASCRAIISSMPHRDA